MYHNKIRSSFTWFDSTQLSTNKARYDLKLGFTQYCNELSRYYWARRLNLLRLYDLAQFNNIELGKYDSTRYSFLAFKW